MTPPFHERTAVDQTPDFTMVNGEFVPGDPQFEQQWDTLQERTRAITGVGLNRFILQDGIPKTDVAEATEQLLGSVHGAVETFFSSDTYSAEERAAILQSPILTRRYVNAYLKSAPDIEPSRPGTSKAFVNHVMGTLYMGGVQEATVSAMGAMYKSREQALSGNATKKTEVAFTKAVTVLEAVKGQPIADQVRQLPAPLPSIPQVRVTPDERQHTTLGRTTAVTLAAATIVFAGTNSAAAAENNEAPASTGNHSAARVSSIEAVTGSYDIFPSASKTTTPVASPDTSVAQQQPEVPAELLVPIPPAERGVTLEEQLVPIPAHTGTPETVTLPYSTETPVTTVHPEVVPTPDPTTQHDVDPGSSIPEGNKRDIDPGIVIPETDKDPRAGVAPGETATTIPGTAEPVESSPITTPVMQTPSIAQVSMPRTRATTEQAVTAMIPSLSPALAGFVSNLRTAAETGDPSVVVPSIPEARNTDQATQNMVRVFALAAEELLTGDPDTAYLLQGVADTPELDVLAQNANLTADPSARLSPEVGRGMAYVMTSLAELAVPAEEQVDPAVPAQPEAPVEQSPEAPAAPETPAEPIAPAPETPSTPVPEAPVPESPAQEEPNVEQPAESTPEPKLTTSEITENADGYKALSLDDVRPFLVMEYTNIKGAVDSGSIEKLFVEPKTGVNYEIKDPEITKKLKTYAELYEAIITGDVTYIKDHEDLLMNLNDEQVQRVMEALQENFGDVLKSDENGYPIALGSKQKVTFARWFASTHSYIASINPLGENGIIPEPEPVVPLPIPDIPKQETPPPTEEAPAPTPETPEPEEGGGNTDKDDIYESLENLGTYSYKDGVRKADWDDIAFLYKYLMKNKKIDFKQHHAVGLLANCVAESSCDPDKNQDGGPAAGAFMWEDRLPALKEFAKEQGLEWDSWKAQSLFLIHEFLTSESGALEKLLAADTAEEAALMVSKYYERPGTPHNDVRVGIAKELEKIIAKTKRGLKDTSRGDAEREDSQETNKRVWAQPVNNPKVTCEINGYSNKENNYHTGTDMISTTGDTRVSAVTDDMKIIKVGYDNAAGNYFIAVIGDTKQFIIGQHFEEIDAEEGDVLNRDDIIGRYGNTGARSQGKHLHLTVTIEGYDWEKYGFPSRKDAGVGSRLVDFEKLINGSN